jgi:hypothetical protein
MKEITLSIDELHSISESISHSGIENSENVSKLEELICKFKINDERARLQPAEKINHY